MKNIFSKGLDTLLVTYMLVTSNHTETAMNYLNYERTKANVRGAVKVTAEIESPAME